jgi:DNA polymerase III psi subunit
MEKTEHSSAFFKSFFNEGIYKIPEKKKYGQNPSTQGNLVSEDKAEYNLSIDSFEGKTSNTLILFGYPAASGMPEKDKVFLNQVLGAVGLAFENVSRLNIENLAGGIQWADIAAGTAADFVIGFGVDPEYLPTGIQEGQIYNIDGKRVLCSASLPELISNNMRKKLLWQGLKEIYGI